MVRLHLSTPDQRVQLVSTMIAAAGTYGAVTQLSQRAAVSRQTLYHWRTIGQRALLAAFTPPPVPVTTSTTLERAILCLLVEGHASYRGIQTCLASLGYGPVSLGRITTVVNEAQRRAQHWLNSHAPISRRSIALDELYGSRRGVGYLSIVDTHSWAVWATAGPVAVDGESWTLLLWAAQTSGLHWYATISDGGRAIAQACQTVEPTGQHGRDVWHVLHECGKVQGRLARLVEQLQAQTPTVARQAERVARGQKLRGRFPQADVAAHQTRLAAAQGAADGVRYLSSELRELLAVVVRQGGRVLTHAERYAEVLSVVSLLGELREHAPASMQHELANLAQHLTLALPGLLRFSSGLEGVQQQVSKLLGAEAVDLVAWAWQRRRGLGDSPEEVLAGLPAQWRSGARLLWTAWEGVARASSAVENWHSILRPHLAVHRDVSTGLIALLAVWHNHRRFARGAHAGQSPLQLSGLMDSPADWLEALGYPPVETTPVRRANRGEQPVLALVA